MTRPLSIDLRERVIDAVDGGMSRRAAAERFGVSILDAYALKRVTLGTLGTFEHQKRRKTPRRPKMP